MVVVRSEEEERRRRRKRRRRTRRRRKKEEEEEKEEEKEKGDVNKQGKQACQRKGPNQPINLLANFPLRFFSPPR